MTSDASFEIPTPVARPRMHWGRAWKSLRALLASPDETDHAIDFVYAIGQADFERVFQRFAATPGGPELLAERPDLAERLADRAALERLPEGSLGRAYLAYLDENHFDARGLLAVQDRVRVRWEGERAAEPLDPLRAWFRDWSLLAHDLSHVVTGYGTDDVGEATLLVFTLAQNGGRAQWLLTLGACLDCWRTLGRGWPSYLARVWRRGRRAAWMPAVPWDDLLAVRLEAVRRVAGLAPPERAHREGIWRAHLGGRSRMRTA